MNYPHPPPLHPTEDDLIASLLHETDRETEVRQHFESCPTCAELAEHLAETLRVFSGEPVPPVDLDHAWQRLRGSLPPVQTAVGRPRLSRFRMLWLPASGLAAIAAVALLLPKLHPSRSGRAAELHLQRPGPLSAQPSDPAMANYLDNAERLLTEVNHASGPLDLATRQQASTLLLHNALYVQQAKGRGDLAEAAVLDQLGRVLTTLQHPPPPASHGWHIRLEMNTDGLLLDIRILRQNDATQ